MAALTNNRHEIFARCLAEGATADAAYVEAGFKTDRGNAARLTANDSIRERVRELQGKAELRFEMNRAEWLEGFARLARKAEAAGDFTAARGCLREIGLALPGWYAAQKAEVAVDAKPGVRANAAALLASPGAVEALARQLEKAAPEARERLRALLAAA